MDRNRTPVIVWAGFALPLLFLAVFFFYPLSAIFQRSLAPEGTLDLSSFADIITSRYYRDTLWFTIWQATLSTVLTVGLALPGAFIFTRFRFPGKSLLLSLATLPFVLPTVVVAAAFTALIGPRGLLNQWLMDLLSLESAPIQLERTLPLILIVHVFYNYAIALRMISGFWANQSLAIEEAARVLGCHGWRLWWEIRLPMLRPIIVAAAMLVFIFTFTSFGVILILGGPRFATLEVEIYRQTVSLFNLPMAAALSLVQIGTMFVMMLLYTRLQRQNTVDLEQTGHIARPPANRRERLYLLANLGLMAVLLFTPLVALVLRSFEIGSGTPSIRFFTSLTENTRNSILFVPPLESVGNSLVFAVMTTVGAVMLGVIAAYMLDNRRTRWLDPLFMLPLATSAVTLGFGFIIALESLRSSIAIIPIAHILVALPFVVRSVLPALRGIPPEIREAACILGAAPWQVRRFIDMPLISRGIIVGATFAFTVSMGEFGASLFVARPDTPTMPVVIFRLLGQPGSVNYGQALAMSSLLMVICGVSFVLIERLRTAGIGEF